jgi:hypothetical protein
LGWSQGISNAEVTLTLKEAGSAGQTLHTDATGVADFGNIPAGDYVAQVSRWLTSSERGQLPAADDANGWVGNQVLRITSASVQEVKVPASRRKSLLISEWSFNHPFELSLGTYLFGGYLTLYNNADTTLYLDGVIIGVGWGVAADYPTFPCSLYDAFTLDGLGAWARFFQRIPGAGRQYPLEPGGHAVIATDAIDHRPLYPGTLDLRAADFEFSGIEDADNPSVPNLEDISSQTSSNGHGLIFQGPTSVAFLARPVDPTALLHAKAPASDITWVRFPRDLLLDYLAIAPHANSAGYPECPVLVSPELDRRPNRANRELTNATGNHLYSLQRRLAGTGSRILQHTRDSDVDFISARRSLEQP